MRLVPWSSWSEWSSVGEALLGGGCGVESALERVATWRCRGRLPLAVEVTACLAEARLGDGALSGRPGLSEAVLRSLYALAVVRLVNGATDPQQKGRFAQPVAHLARQLGLPSLLVELRHETAHNELPSLACLRHAAALALGWCGARYWEPQQAALAARACALAAALRDLADACTPAPARRAAAGGASASAAGDGDERDGGAEGGSPCAAAGEAPPAVGEPAGPSLSAKRRRRGAALRALSELVPFSAPHLLVAPLLDDQRLLLAPHAAPQTAAWTEALHALSRRWTTLPWLLLSGCATRLARCRPEEAQRARVAGLRDAVPFLARSAAPISPQQRRAVTLMLLSTPQECAWIADAAAAAAAQMSAASAPPVAGCGRVTGEATLAAAEEELRCLKRKRAQAGPPAAWARVAEWPPTGVAAPPAWACTMGDGAPAFEKDTQPLKLASALFPEAGPHAPHVIAPHVWEAQHLDGPPSEEGSDE